MEAELQDWELLHNNTDDDYDVVTAPADDEFSREFDDESESGIRSDYFALGSNHDNRNEADTEVTSKEEVDDQGSVQSDNPSWLDPSSSSSHTFETTKDSASAEFWSDSASDGSSKGFEQGLECKHELGFEDEIPGNFGFVSNRVEFGSGESCSDPGGESEIRVKLGSGDGGAIKNDLGVSAESDGGEGRRGESDSSEEIGSLCGQVVNSGEGGGDKRGGNVWWKLPLELLKFCVFRVSPVWSVSIAAAVVGLVILKRRLYKMKHKTQRIVLNVTLEDNKKVSQFMARATRLNEAFSVVKRVPMIRPSLPAAGLTPWPVMSLR